MPTDPSNIGLGDLGGDGDLDVLIANGHFQTTSYPALISIIDGMGNFTSSGW